MSKIRVYELAKDLKIESKLLMNTLKSIGISVPSHQSMLTDDNVEKVRKAISGEAVKEGTPTTRSVVSRTPESGSGAVRVIRRRRGNDQEEAAPEEVAEKETTEAAAAPDSQAAAALAARPPETPVAESPTTAPAEPVTATGQATTLQREEPKPQADQPQARSTTPEQRSPAPPSQPAGSQQPQTRSYSTGVAPSGPSQGSGQRSFTPGPDNRRPPNSSRPEERRRMSSGGATIVRKVTPEEIESRRLAIQQQQLQQQQQQQQQQQRQQYDGPRRPVVRREDSKGTKYTGFGGPPVIEPTLETTEDTNKLIRRVKDKPRKEIEESEEAAAIAAKKAATKGRKSGYNMRQLLSEIELEETLELDPEAEALAAAVKAAEEEEAAAAARAKTVYTPNFAQRKKDLKRRKDLKKTEITVSRQAYRIVRMGNEITVGELAHQLKVKATDVIKKLMDQGTMVTINEVIDFDTATLIASEFGFEVKTNIKSIDEILGKNVDDVAVGDEERPPIVTVMGHVDHGKTSILDAIRKTDVAAHEAGGITQHIGAYSVVHNGRKITFLDTPGHEAFSSMRARGANLTDIVVLVVAADDGVMPQTIEAISHAKEAKVPMIVAVNKIDKPSADVERILRELSEKAVIAEEWGGDTQFVKVSALTRVGINELLEAILLQTDILELKTSSTVPAEGVVVEANLDQGRGPIATVLVRNGTLQAGDYLVAGKEFGRVRAMYDHRGSKVEKAGPATPVQVLGLSGVPGAGDRATVVKDEKTAREAVTWAVDNSKSGIVKTSAQSLEDLLGKMKQADTPELPIIVKADTQGSLEAIVDALTKQNSDRVRNRVVHKAVGGISESDISLADASGAALIGFNVRASRGLDEAAEKRGVVIKYFSIIYDLVDSVKALMAGKLPSIIEEVVIGRAEVRQSIQVPKIGTIAGSSVTDGRISRSSGVRLIRNDVVIYTGKISSLRRFKDDVREVKSGFECGIGIENYNDLHIGDVIEAFEVKETRPTL